MDVRRQTWLLSRMPTTPLATAGPATDISRRALLGGAAAVGVAAALGVLDSTAAVAKEVRSDPFAIGVASGDPLPSSVILWTRLIADASEMSSRDIEVEWEIASDPTFRHRVTHGEAVARAVLGHSVHVNVRGLAPATDYWYRFRSHGFVSPGGRTRTAPAAGAMVSSLRLAVVNCQDYQNGYWPAYSALAEEDVDVVLHLGDYIYEYDPNSVFPDRVHTAPQTPGLDQLVTLEDYRARHVQYKRDPALQAAHAIAPWIPTWDDHEVENNYASLTDEIDDTGARLQSPAQFALQRAAAYQAYYEHMPIRARLVPGSPDLRIFRRFDFGDLARLNVLDTRQYRTDQPGGFSQDFGPEAAGAFNVAGTLTGADQEAWLSDGLLTSGAQWNVIAQQVMMSRTRFPNFLPQVPLPFLTNLDQWDGYAPQRQRMLQFLDTNSISNPIVLAGDIHSSWFSNLTLNFNDPSAAVVAAEFVAASVSSDFPAAFVAPIEATNPVLNPHVRYFQARRHGYLRMDVNRERWLTEERTVESITTRTSPVATTGAFVSAAGSPGVVPA
jgi:alkaline phosphatase D